MFTFNFIHFIKVKVFLAYYYALEFRRKLTKIFSWNIIPTCYIVKTDFIPIYLYEGFFYVFIVIFFNNYTALPAGKLRTE